MQQKRTGWGGGILFDNPSGTSPSLADLLSDRIAELLGRAIEEPEALTPNETREMAASIVFYLISQRRA